MGICKYKGIINGCCNMNGYDFVEIMKMMLEKLLLVLFKYIVGCNNVGKMIVCYCGGGMKC